MLRGWCEERQVFWTAVSCQLCYALECLGSARAATGQQGPCCPFLLGYSTTALQQAEPRVWALMCWHVAGQAVITRKVPGQEQSYMTRNMHSPKVAHQKIRLLVLACVWPCAYFL